MPQPAPFLLDHLLALDAAVRAAEAVPDSPLHHGTEILRSRYAAEIGHDFARQRRPDPAVALDLFAGLLAALRASRVYDGARPADALDTEYWEDAALAAALPWRLNSDALRQRAEETWQAWQQQLQLQQPPGDRTLYLLARRVDPATTPAQTRAFPSAVEAFTAFLTRDEPASKLTASLLRPAAARDGLPLPALAAAAAAENAAVTDPADSQRRITALRDAQALWLSRRMAVSNGYFPQGAVSAEDRWAGAVTEWAVRFHTPVSGDVVNALTYRRDLELPPDALQAAAAQTQRLADAIAVWADADLEQTDTADLTRAFQALQPVIDHARDDSPALARVGGELLDELAGRTPGAQYLRGVLEPERGDGHLGQSDPHRARLDRMAREIARAYTAAVHGRPPPHEGPSPESLPRTLHDQRWPVTVALNLNAQQARTDPWARAAHYWSIQHPSAGRHMTLLREQIAAAQEAAARPDAPTNAEADLTYRVVRLETAFATHAVLGRLSFAPGPLPDAATTDPLRSLSASLAQQQRTSQDREMVLAAFPTPEHAHIYLTGRIAAMEDQTRLVERGLESVTRAAPDLLTIDIAPAQEAMQDSRRERDALRRALARLEEIEPASAALTGLDARAIAAATARAMARPATSSTRPAATGKTDGHQAQQATALQQQQPSRPAPTP